MSHGDIAAEPGRHRPRKKLVFAAAAVAAGLVVVGPGLPANALEGDPATGTTYDFVAKVTIGAGDNARGCTGALVAPQWIITALDCFGSGPVALGAPPASTIVTVGRADLTGTDGHVSPVVYLVPNPDRGVVLAKLATPATGITPVPLGTTVPAAGDELQGAGFGRTSSEWVPDRLHVGSFDVTGVDAGTLTVSGVSPKAAVCRGDAGGPLVRATGSGIELVGLHYRSWQGGCLGESETRRDAVETRLDDLGGWIRQNVADVTVFGALADGRLTWSAIDSATGDRLTTVTSAATLGFTPKALATLNATTLLVTDTGGGLYRVDVTATDPALTFATPVRLAGGWTHQLLTYDGDGTLFGLAGDTLRRYTVTSAKPAAANIINNTVVGSGFTLQAMSATGPDWIIGSTSTGTLRGYRIGPDGTWAGSTLASSGWSNLAQLVSPGNGLYYARTSAGGLNWYTDKAPFDGVGTDIQAHAGDPVDTSGWNQVALGAVPLRANPQNAADLAVYGVDSTNHLTYTTAQTVGQPIATATSDAPLPFAAKAIATLNFDTVLVTSTAGALYRVDVTSTLPTLTFTATQLGTGWTHQLLSYDGYGSLFGIAGSTLHRYTVGSAKPTAADITAHTVIDSGFTLKTMTATGPGWILGTTSAGTLLSYQITGAGAWAGHTLATTGWGTYTDLLTPGNGLYYARIADGSVTEFADAAPFDGKGTDITNKSPATGLPEWPSKLVSIQPFIA
jgi:hypothetical protein